MSNGSHHTAVLQNELNWFNQVLKARLEAYFSGSSFEQQPAPAHEYEGAHYAKIIQEMALTDEERLIIMLAMAPHLQPQSLDSLLVKNPALNSSFPEFGGFTGKYHKGFLPTGETAVFLFSGANLTQRAEALKLLAPDSKLMLSEILLLEEDEKNEPRLSRPLILSPEFAEYFITGKKFKPESFALFPAKKIETSLDWADLVVDEYVAEELELMKCWMCHENYLMGELDLRKTIKPGYRALFYGPPGTGKTLTACLLGKATGYDVYRIDLSHLVSKYIGETEKNLAKVFDLAQRNKWILFFDEADAIFGKRTATNSANDRYANQEVAYLLQRVEDFPGIIILASNLKSNMDEAFSRRFQSEVYFPMPGPDHRRQIWQNTFNGKLSLAADIDLPALAGEYELSGGATINVYRHAVLKAMRREEKEPLIQKHDILQGIRRELQKEGKTLQTWNNQKA